MSQPVAVYELERLERISRNREILKQVLRKKEQLEEEEENSGSLKAKKAREEEIEEIVNGPERKSSRLRDQKKKRSAKAAKIFFESKNRIQSIEEDEEEEEEEGEEEEDYSTRESEEEEEEEEQEEEDDDSQKRFSRLRKKTNRTSEEFITIQDDDEEAKDDSESIEEESENRFSRLRKKSKSKQKPKSSSSSSPTPPQNYRIMFTCVECDIPMVRFIESQGGQIIDLPTNSIKEKSIPSTISLVTHLVMSSSKFHRTFKFLCCVSLVPYIVTERWIEESMKAGKFVDEQNWELADALCDKEWSFKISETLRRRNKLLSSTGNLLFSNFVFVLGDGGKSSKEQIENVLKCAGSSLIPYQPVKVKVTLRTFLEGLFDFKKKNHIKKSIRFLFHDLESTICHEFRQVLEQLKVEEGEESVSDFIISVEQVKLMLTRQELCFAKF